MLDRFDGIHAQVLGISVDSVPCLKAWAESLGGISYPLLSDFYPHGQVAETYGVLRTEGYSERAIFVIDKHRIIRYMDVHDIDQQPDNDELFRILEELEPQQALPARKQNPVKAESRQSADVVLYCTPWCPECRRARTYLKDRGIDFIEIDITRDGESARQVRAWANGYETTPTFNIKGTIIVNFVKERLDRALASLSNPDSF